MDAPVSAGVTTSTIGSGTVLPRTPPSVSKPPQTSGEKSETISTVQRALFSETSTAQELGSKVGLVPPIQPEEDGLPVVTTPDSSSPSSIVAPMDKKNNRRRQQKPPVDTPAKKNKP